MEGAWAAAAVLAWAAAVVVAVAATDSAVGQAGADRGAAGRKTRKPCTRKTRNGWPSASRRTRCGTGADWCPAHCAVCTTCPRGRSRIPCSRTESSAAACTAAGRRRRTVPWRMRHHGRPTCLGAGSSRMPGKSTEGSAASCPSPCKRAGIAARACRPSWGEARTSPVRRGKSRTPRTDSPGNASG